MNRISAAVVLMGAGASFGCGDVYPRNPPLGNDLFDALEARGGIAATLPPEIKEQFRRNFEEGMAAYRTGTGDNVMGFQRELARYLAQFQPGFSNVYCDMIRALRGHNVVYASLNYDLLFELAANAVGLNVSYASVPLPGFVRLLKPHGSCNFWPDSVGRVALQNVTFLGLETSVEGLVKPLTQGDTLLRCEQECSLAPAIALYAEGKAVKVCREFVDKQLQQLSELILSSEAVFVTGVRVNPADTHIWNTLAQTKGRVRYYGLKGDRTGFTNWTAQAGRKDDLFIEAEFPRAAHNIAQNMGTP